MKEKLTKIHGYCYDSNSSSFSFDCRKNNEYIEINIIWTDKKRTWLYSILKANKFCLKINFQYKLIKINLRCQM